MFFICSQVFAQTGTVSSKTFNATVILRNGITLSDITISSKYETEESQGTDSNGNSETTISYTEYFTLFQTSNLTSSKVYPSEIAGIFLEDGRIWKREINDDFLTTQIGTTGTIPVFIRTNWLDKGVRINSAWLKVADKLLYANNVITLKSILSKQILEGNLQPIPNFDIINDFDELIRNLTGLPFDDQRINLNKYVDIPANKNVSMKMGVGLSNNKSFSINIGVVFPEKQNGFSPIAEFLFDDLSFQTNTDARFTSLNVGLQKSVPLRKYAYQARRFVVAASTGLTFGEIYLHKNDESDIFNKKIKLNLGMQLSFEGKGRLGINVRSMNYYVFQQRTLALSDGTTYKIPHVIPFVFVGLSCHLNKHY